jgi:hypothetical protein
VAISRPVATLTFCAENALGLDTPAARHQVQVGLYMLVVLMAGWLVHRLARAAGTSEAAALSLLVWGGPAFAWHPTHAEVVMSLAYRPELLSLLLTLIATALLLSVRLGRARPWTVPLALLAFAAALLAKESALAAWLAWAAWAVSTQEGRRRLWKPLLMLGIVAAAWLAWRRWNIGTVLAGQIPFADNPLVALDAPTRILNALAILARATTHLLWPVGLAPDYTFDAWPVLHRLTWLAAAGALILLGLVAAIAFHVRKSLREPALPDTLAPAEVTVLALSWLAAFWLPVSNLLFPSTVLFADRLLFAPSLPVCFAAGLPFAWVARHGTTSVRVRRMMLPLLAIYAAWLAIGMAQSQHIAEAWQSDLKLFRLGVAAQPMSGRMRYDLALALVQKGEPDQARHHQQVAAGLLPTNPQVLVLGFELARPGEAGDHCADAEPHLRVLAKAAGPAIKPRQAATEWAFACRRMREVWPIARNLPPRSVHGSWPKRLFALGIAAGDGEGATTWARAFGVEPWSQPDWVAAAVFGEEHAGRPLAALQHLVTLHKARPDLRGLDIAARDLYQRHAQAGDAPAMQALLRQTWP